MPRYQESQIQAFEDHLEFLHLAFMALEHEKSPGYGKLLFNNVMK